MVKTTKIILSILLLFALLAVSGCTGTDGSADDASSEVAEDTAMEVAEDAAMEEAAIEESAADEEETESEEAETTEESVSTNATLHECDSCHAAYTMDEMGAGIHKEAFSENNSVMHVAKCSECHNVEVDCASCHDLPEVMKAQVTT